MSSVRLPCTILVLCGTSIALGCSALLGVEDWEGSSTTTGGPDAGHGGAGGDPGAGGGGGAAGGLPGKCGGTSLLGDDFDAPALGAAWSIVGEGHANVVPEKGDVVFQLDGTSPGGASLVSSRFFSLLGDGVTVKTSPASQPAAGSILQLTVGYDIFNVLDIRNDGGMLRSGAVNDGKLEAIAAEPFVAEAHRFWRIREDAGTIYWETSADGVTFTAKGTRSTGTLFPLDVVRIWLRGANSVVGAPQELRFEQVNGGKPSGAYCKAASLTDDFEDPARARAWALTMDGLSCAQLEQQGELVMTPQKSTPSACAYLSAADYDLRDSSLEVAVTQNFDTMATASYEYLRAMVDGTNYIEIFEVGGGLYASSRVAGTVTLGSIAFDPIAHRHWRIREVSGTTFWEVSADRTTWQELRQEPTPLDVHRVQIFLGGAAFTEPAAPGSLHFDDLNLGR